MIPQLALVIWSDHFCSDQPITRESAERLQPLKRMAVGWVLADTDAGITLAMDIAEEAPDEGDPYLFLGREMIREVIPLRTGPTDFYADDD